MGRFLGGVGILLACLALGIWVGVVMDARHESISQTLRQAADESMSGNLEQGIALAEEAQQQWDKHWHSSAALADHAPMDEIDSLFAQLQIYGLAGQTVDFASFCTRLAKLVSAMGETHSLTWWNLA